MKLLFVFIIKQSAVLTEVGFTKQNGTLNTFIGNLHTRKFELSWTKEAIHIKYLLQSVTISTLNRFY